MIGVISLPVVVLVTILTSAAPVQGSQQPGTPPDSLSRASYNDGPHVHWRNDSTAVVIYACDGKLDTTWIAVGDTLTFSGRCDDSLVTYNIPRDLPRISPAVYDGVSRFLVVSDLHGEFERFAEFLRNASVVDHDGHWIWADGHLVINGDVFDRGTGVTECLWMIYRLEQEAERAGGHVHLLLGNHELMALRNDLRYVNEKYTGGIARTSRIDYDDLFGPDMELGRWLRSKNTVELINGVLVVHGGLSPSTIERGLTIAAINDSVRALIDVSSARETVDEFTRYLFGATGPVWYRGYHDADESRYPRASGEDLTAVLQFYGANAVVVGHTEVPVVTSLYDGRVFAVDVPVEESGSFQGLLWEDGRFSRVNGDGVLDPIE